MSVPVSSLTLILSIFSVSCIFILSLPVLHLLLAIISVFFIAFLTINSSHLLLHYISVFFISFLSISIFSSIISVSKSIKYPRFYRWSILSSIIFAGPSSSLLPLLHFLLHNLYILYLRSFTVPLLLLLSL